MVTLREAVREMLFPEPVIAHRLLSRKNLEPNFTRLGFHAMLHGIGVPQRAAAAGGHGYFEFSRAGLLPPFGLRFPASESAVVLSHFYASL